MPSSARTAPAKARSSRSFPVPTFRTRAKSNWTAARSRGPARARRKAPASTSSIKNSSCFRNSPSPKTCSSMTSRCTRFGIIDYRPMERRADDALRRLGAKIDVRRRVKELTVADQQMVEIARAFVGSVKVLILDEPTAVISGREVDLLFDRLVALRAAGVAIIYISHRLEEIFRIADRVTVLKDGVRVATRPVNEVNRDQLISMMVGRALSDVFPPRRPLRNDAPILLRAEGISVGTAREERLFDAAQAARSLASPALSARAGLNWPRRSLAECRLTPARSRSRARSFTRTSPRSSIEAGVGLLTEDRKGEGLLMHLERRRQHRRAAARRNRARAIHRSRAPRTRSAPRRSRDFPLRHRTAGSRRRPVGRQPAEGAVQPLGPGLPSRAAARRADARQSTSAPRSKSTASYGSWPTTGSPY